MEMVISGSKAVLAAPQFVVDEGMKALQKKIEDSALPDQIDLLESELSGLTEAEFAVLDGENPSDPPETPSYLDQAQNPSD